MAAMKRAAAVFLLLVMVLAAFWLATAVSAQRTRTTAVHFDWPMGLGTLDEVPKRYPPRDTSNDAARLTVLAAAAGVDLAPIRVGIPTPRGNAEAFRPALSRFLETELTRSDNGAGAPPAELAQYFAANDAALGAVREYLVGRAAIIWPTDVVAAAQAPLPNLGGNLALARLLVAHALTSRETASQDLCAAWHLQRALWHRPELISKQVALAGTRMVNAAARRLDSRPAWFDEMRTIDYRRSMLAAQQSEAWIVRKQIEDVAQRDMRITSPREVVDAVLQPYDEMCAANLAAVMRRAAGEMAQSRDCAVDGAALDRRVRSMLPFWNRPAHRSTANVGSVWQRVARFQAELEATDRIFELKRRGWPQSAPDLERSDCADGTWVVANGNLRFSRPIAAPRPMLAIPLEYAGR